MQYPKLTILMALLVIALGHGLVADKPGDSVLFRAADAVKDTAQPVVKRMEWRVIRWQAARGDACSVGRVAWAHYAGYQMIGFEYSGLKFDRDKARELFRRSIELGCDETGDGLIFYDYMWPDQLAAFRDDVGRVDWQNVQAAASTGDPDARYFVAKTMMRSPALARRRGVAYDPEKGFEMLSRLADERYVDAMLTLAEQGEGITLDLNRAYNVLMDTTWKVMPTLRIHMRFLETAIDGCNPSAWAKAMDIWSTLGPEVHASVSVDAMLGDAHTTYLSTCSGPGS